MAFSRPRTNWRSLCGISNTLPGPATFTMENAPRLYRQVSFHGQHSVARPAPRSHFKQVERAAKVQRSGPIRVDRQRLDAVEARLLQLIAEPLAHDVFEDEREVLDRCITFLHGRMVPSLNAADHEVAEHSLWFHALHRSRFRSCLRLSDKAVAEMVLHAR